MSRVGRFHVWVGPYANIAAGGVAVFALSSYGFWLRFVSPLDTPVPLWLMGGVAVASAIVSLFCIGICVGRPVGLRLDADGLSGYFVPPLEWSQVAEVGLHKIQRYKTDSYGRAVGPTEQCDEFLALRLYDAKAWRMRATLIQRTLFMKLGWNTRWDVLLPLKAIHVPDSKELIHLACNLHEGR